MTRSHRVQQEQQNWSLQVLVQQSLLAESWPASLFQWEEVSFDPDWHCFLLVVGPMLEVLKWLKEVKMIPKKQME
jgi:hypothetical protein